jgi:hypothetical protein
MDIVEALAGWTTYAIKHRRSHGATGGGTAFLPCINRMRQRACAAALDPVPLPVGCHEGREFFGDRPTGVEPERPHDKRQRRAIGLIGVRYIGLPDLHLR